MKVNIMLEIILKNTIHLAYFVLEFLRTSLRFVEHDMSVTYIMEISVCGLALNSQHDEWKNRKLWEIENKRTRRKA